MEVAVTDVVAVKVEENDIVEEVVGVTVPLREGVPL